MTANFRPTSSEGLRPMGSLVVLTLDDLKALERPLGTPCSCGRGADRHLVPEVYPTPTRWAMRSYEHFQSASGVWWTVGSTPRYFPTKEAAQRAADQAALSGSSTQEQNT